MRTIRPTAVILLTVMLLFLCSCGKTSMKLSDALPTSALTEGTDAGYDFILNFSEDETRAMSNYMLRNRFLITDGVLWGTDFSYKEIDGWSYCEPKICAMPFTFGNSGAAFEDISVIAEGVDTEFLVRSGDYIYCLLTALNSAETSIARIYIPTHGFEIIYPSPCSTLQLFGDRLYVLDGESHLVSMDLNGGNIVQIVSDRSIYYPYMIADDWLLFQDDSAGESLKLRYLPTGYEVTVSEGRVYEYVINGSVLYYSKVEDSESMKGRLCNVNLNEFFKGFNPDSPQDGFSFYVEQSDKNTGTRFSINGDHINGSNYKTYKLKNWKMLDDRQYEIGYLSACQYVSEQYEVFYNYEVEDLVHEICFYRTADGKNSYIPRIPG